jgi:hypothetical protein
VPRETLYVPPIFRGRTPLHPGRLRVPYLPVRPISVYESSVRHSYLSPHADPHAIVHPRSTKGASCGSASRCLDTCFSRVYLAKLASVSLITSIIDLAIQRSLPL